MGRPTAIDLFSGCGGLTLGLKMAGFRIIGAVENDPLAVDTYKANHKRVKVWETDIRRLTVKEVLKKLNLCPGELDLLAGCPPCQGFSSINTLNGAWIVNDKRNELIFEFLRFVRVLKPKAIMMENVPGLAKNKYFSLFCTKIRNLGYNYEYRILNAADYGVPQRRRRIIFLGSKFGKIEFADKAPYRLTVRDIIATMPKPGKSEDPLHDFPERRSKNVMCLISKIPRNGGSRTALEWSDQLPCHKKCPDGFKDIYGRMAWDEVAPTITSGCVNPSKGRFLHPTQNRTITLREAALLQSFPPDYVFSLKRGKQVATLIGNALPPEFMKYIATPVLAYIKNLKNAGRSI